MVQVWTIASGAMRVDVGQGQLMKSGMKYNGILNMGYYVSCYHLLCQISIIKKQQKTVACNDECIMLINRLLTIIWQVMKNRFHMTILNTKCRRLLRGKLRSRTQTELHGRKVILFMPWECPGKNYQKSEGYELIKVRRVWTTNSQKSMN